MSGDSKSESAAKVEEKVRVESRGPGAYTAHLWVGDRYFRASGQTEGEARNALPCAIYEAHAQGEAVDPDELPAAVRKAVADYGILMAEIARSELLKLTALHLDFAPNHYSQNQRAADDLAVYVLSPLEVAANCIHRGADLADTDPALLPSVVSWFHAEITAIEHGVACLAHPNYAQAAADEQAKANALKATLARHGFGWVYVAATGNR